MCIALMFRNVNSQINVKIDIKCVIYILNMQEQIIKSYAFTSLKVTYLSIREYPNLLH